MSFLVVAMLCWFAVALVAARFVGAVLHDVAERSSVVRIPEA